MEIYPLKVFVRVARHLSFTEAAAALNLTQPAVSAKIKALESELGSPLFYRLGRKVALTEMGQLLLQEADVLIQQEERLSQKILDFKQGGEGVLNIGCSTAIADSFLPRIIYTYRHEHPNIAVKLHSLDTSTELYEAITRGTVDIGFADMSFAGAAELVCQPVGTFHYRAIASPQHAIARREWCSLKDLTETAWVIGSERLASRTAFVSRLLELGMQLSDFERIETVDTLSLMRTYLQAGKYVGFASDLDFQHELAAGTLVAVALQEFAFNSQIYAIASEQMHREFSASSSRRRRTVVHPVQKLLALLDRAPALTNRSPLELAESKPPSLRSPHYSISTRTASDAEPLSFNIGIQNATIPTVTAGLVMQKLGMLEHYLPRSGRYSAIAPRIQWHNFQSGSPIVDGLHSQQLDIGILGDYPLLLSAARNAQHPDPSQRTLLVSFVTINPDGRRNAAIVPSHSQVQDINDLRGRNIAIPFGSAAHGMVLRVLHQMELLDEVKLVPLDESHVLGKGDRSVASYAHFSPFHEIALQQDRFKYLFDGHVSGLPGFYGVVVREAFALQYPELVISYLQAMLAAQHWQHHTTSSLGLIGNWSQTNSAILSNLLGNIVNPSMYLLDTTLRTDWLQAHVQKHDAIPGAKTFSDIELNNWVRSEYLEKARSL
ncbi:MAG: LysR substrate-binding domain-containing protein [Cyanobacteria bacterium J06642_2]